MGQWNSALLWGLVVLLGCSSPSDQKGTHIPDDLTRRDKLRYQQYLLQGKQLYQLHCQNCHKADGKGMARLYPPLAKADYLTHDLERAACIVKFGQSGEIVVNGVSYNMKMPALSHLTALEIAEIITYVSNSWGNKAGFTTAQDVQRSLSQCSQDTE